MPNITITEPPKEKVNRRDISIQLSEQENQLFSLLLNANRELHLGSTLRVAGGWVRDKILGKTCHDIDIAIDNMTGYEYIKALPEWLAEKGYTTSNIGVIKANPEKSKHLETATIRILGSDIDFVNLRKEEYTDDSRIPVISIGTPLEDAYRRDLTVNSLFYNINEAVVEDYTLRGIEDLAQRRARTPLPALQTFIDDPLRILRTIRFASRFGLSIENDILKAMEEYDILDCLARKVSKERVGVEVLKMAQTESDFLMAVNLLERMHLMSCIFNLECDYSTYMRTQRNRNADEFYDQLFLIQIPLNELQGCQSLEGKHVNSLFDGMTCDCPAYRIADQGDPVPVVSAGCDSNRKARKYFRNICEKSGEMQRYVECFERFSTNYNLFQNSYFQSLFNNLEEGPQATMRLACLLYPFKYIYLCGYKHVVMKKKTEVLSTVFSPLIKHFVRECLKLKNTVIDNICWIVHREHEIHSYLQASLEGIPTFTEQEQVILGNLLLQSKELWPFVMVMNAVDAILKNEWSEDQAMIACDHLVSYIREKEMDRMWQIPPIINGNELNGLGVEKGPQMKEVMDSVRNWMIIHPHGTREECIEAVIRK